MSTEYTLYDDIELRAEVTLHESSNTLSLGVFNGFGTDSETTPYMKPDEMLKLLIEGIKVCSYWMKEKEVQKILATIETYGG